MEDFNEMLTFARLEIAQKKQRQKRLAVVGLLLMVVMIFTIGITVAMLNTKTKSEINKFGFGQAKVDVIENDDYDWAKKEVQLSVPIPAAGSGEIVVPGVARAMFVPYIVGSDGNYISVDLGAMTKPVAGKMTLGDIIFEFAADWETHWFYQNGYFYYRKVLYPETGKNQTPILLKKVSFAGNAADMMDKYDSNQIYVDVLASILQAEGSAPEVGKVLDTEWSVKISSGTVSPKTP